MIDPKSLDRTLALAGVFQAATMVQSLAKKGRVDELYFRGSIESLFKIDATDTPDVYGGIPNVELGLKSLIDLFTDSNTPKDSDIARYVFSLLHLERKLFKNEKMFQIIHSGLERARIQSTHFTITHENVLANIAGIYTDTLSTFRFKIFITGEPLHINQTNMMNKMRALLLAGIRSAVLWRQMGGRRWQLLFTRASVIKAAQKLLASIHSSQSSHSINTVHSREEIL